MAPQSSTIIDVVIKEMQGIVESEENLHILNVKARDFRRVEEILEHNRKKLQDEHEKLPKPVGKCCLEALKDSVEDAKSLINRAQQQPGCFSCCFGSKPKTDLSEEKIEWKRKFDDIYQQLQSLSVVAAEIGVQGSERPPPKLKSDQIGQQIAESAGPRELKSDHTDRQMAKTTEERPQSTDFGVPMASELKSDGTRQIAESARPLEFKSDRTRQILESASPPNKKYDASASSPELKNDAFVDRQQIAESIKKDPQKFKDSQFQF